MKKVKLFQRMGRAFILKYFKIQVIQMQPYREKYSGNVGYVANLVESFNDNSGVITHYDLKPNTYSDIRFCEDVLDALSKVP